MNDKGKRRYIKNSGANVNINKYTIKGLRLKLVISFCKKIMKYENIFIHSPKSNMDSKTTPNMPKSAKEAIGPPKAGV